MTATTSSAQPRTVAETTHLNAVLDDNSITQIAEMLSRFETADAYQTIARLNQATFVSLRLPAGNNQLPLLINAGTIARILAGDEDDRLQVLQNLEGVENENIRTVANNRILNLERAITAGEMDGRVRGISYNDEGLYDDRLVNAADRRLIFLLENLPPIAARQTPHYQFLNDLIAEHPNEAVNRASLNRDRQYNFWPAP